MLTVHHLGVSQSERIVWLCEELEIPYELKLYQREPPMRGAPAEYKALHPIATAPIITDGNVVLPESGAIVEYIINKYGQGRLSVGPDAPNYADYLFWLHFANASLMARIARAPAEAPGEAPTAKIMRDRALNALAVVEQRLGEVPYLAGQDFTAADIMTVFALTTMRLFVPRDISGYPNILAYLQRVAARPGYQRAMQKGDPTLTPNLT